jgi:monofunctional biosynthetic peptidoglycan transglycosylase
VLPNPRKFDPLGSSKYVQNRSRLIYNIMVKRGIVVPEYEEINEGRASDETSGNEKSPNENIPVEETKPSAQ